ncbi:glycosyltransferase [uncultured Imperialibacter sp.]|uniref:glycosyltransferase n=1 Tax=uncultured Imperialibacter sp. TaxID=1672639 RepID=UPI0030D7B5E1|tara:strand:- start:221 stop:1408 length:1188 start_codon:yes stop_codon:yes gene_type:complete
MKVLHVCTHDQGGAAVAALRLHEALKQNGVTSKFLVLYRSDFNNDSIEFKPSRFGFFFRRVKAKVFRLFGKKKQDLSGFEVFSSPNTIYDVRKSTEYQQADIIHLHWVANFVDFGTFFPHVTKPIVWTFHDLNPILGGFHYLIDKNNADTHLSEMEHQYSLVKREYLNNRAVHVIAPCEWMKQMAVESGIQFASVRKINYCVNTSIFRFLSKTEARINLGLPQDKHLFLCVASDINVERKGFRHILYLADEFEENQGVTFLVVGKSATEFNRKNIDFIGVVSEPELLRAYYAAADALLLPSEEDNLPNVMLEAQCVGCPAIGFKVGGIIDVITSGVNGLLANQVSSEGFLSALASFLEGKYLPNRELIAKTAQTLFSEKKISGEVTNLYKTIIKV